MLIPIAAFFSYIVESVFGFGGTITLLSITSSFIDIKQLITLALVCSASASSYIIFQSYKYILKNILLKMFIISTPGLILGTYLVSVLDGAVLFKIFSVILIIYGVWGYFKPHIKLQNWVKNIAIMLGGVASGMFSTGGPLLIIGVRTDFENKQQLRATMACYFLLSNIWRFIQLQLQGVSFVLEPQIYGLSVFGVLLAVFIGYKMHLKLPEEKFNKGLNLLFIIIGVIYLLK